MKVIYKRRSQFYHCSKVVISSYQKMNSMIIKCYNKKCHAYHIYPPNNADHINVIEK